MEGFVSALFFALLAAPVALAFEARSRIEEVTVYEDRAMVKRGGRVEVKPGGQEIVFPGLPSSLMDESVRVAGRGEVSSAISGIEVKRVRLKKPRQEKISELEKALETLKGEETLLSGRIGALDLRMKFLESIRVGTSDEISKELLFRSPNLEDWDKIGGYIASRSEEITEKRPELLREMKGLKRKIAAAEAALKQQMSCAPLEEKRVTVALEARAEGMMELDLSYVIPLAAWEPLYDARADHDASEVALTYSGVVRQKTGEDWSDVRLSLSTARPSVLGRPPEIEPWYIGFAGREYASRRAAVPMAAKAAAPPMEALVEDEMVLEEAADYSVARAEERGSAVTFVIPKKESVPADGAAHKAVVAQLDFRAYYSYVAVPRLSEYPYLLTRFVNDTDYPLLPGTVNLFLGPDFVGSSAMDSIAKGEECRLYLGIDEGIKVKRELVEEEASRGIVRRKTGWKTFAYRITVENYRKGEEKITVYDQLPVSRSPDVKVRLEKASPSPKEREEVDEEERKPGVLQWDLALKPGEKREIEYAFSVEYPKERTLQGL